MPACKGMKLMIFGGLLIVNEIYWGYPWATFFGALLIVKGLMVLLFKGKCGCNKDKCCKPEEKKEKKETSKPKKKK